MIIDEKDKNDVNKTNLNKIEIEQIIDSKNNRFKFNKMFILLLFHIILIILLLYLLLDMLFSNKINYLCNFMNEISILLYIFFNLFIILILYFYLESINESDLKNIIKFRKILLILKLFSFTIILSKFLPSYNCLSFKNNFYYYFSFFHIFFETLILNIYFLKIKNDIRNASQFLSQYK